MKIIIVAHDSSFCFYNFHPFVSCFTVPTIDHSLTLSWFTPPQAREMKAKTAALLKFYYHTHTHTHTRELVFRARGWHSHSLMLHRRSATFHQLQMIHYRNLLSSAHVGPATISPELHYFRLLDTWSSEDSRAAHISRTSKAHQSLWTLSPQTSFTDPPPFRPTSSPSSGNGR